MPVRVKDPTDIQSAYDDFANPSRTEKALSDAERSSDTPEPWVTAAQDQIDAFKDNEADKVAAAENSQSSNPGWAVNRSSGLQPNPLSRGKKIAGLAKKGGPIGAIIGLLIAGASVISFFGGPGLLIVNFAEVLGDKFNYQLGVMDARNTRIIQAKLNNTTKGCAIPASPLCKYSTFSDLEVERFEKAGITVNKGGTGITGRNKIDSFELEVGGKTKTISPAEFKSAMKDVPEFNTAMKNAYNMKSLGTKDSIFMRVLESYRSNKSKPFTDAEADDNDRAAKLDDTVKNGSEQDLTNGVCQKANNCSEQETENNKKGAQAAQDIVDEAADETDSVANRVLRGAGDIIDGASDDIADAAAKVGNAAGDTFKIGTSAIKITGVVDNACMVYGWVKAFALTAKVVRSAQLVRYAMVFLKSASMIKAGVARAKDISYLGGILTAVSMVNGKKTKSATDSLGYRYAAFGDTGMTASSTNAVIGATFPASIQGAINFITSSLGSRGKADSTCGFLANPIVQAGSLIVGLASFFTGVGEVKLTAQAFIAPVLIVIAGFLPPMLGEMLTGKVVTPSTKGEVSGDLITSGTSALLSKSSTRGGNSILKRSQVADYMNYQNSVLADYADYDRNTLSPFDASSPNTFLGSIYTRFAPYLTASASATGAISSIGSILTGSVSNLLTHKASAVAENYSTCEDPAVVELDMATDPYCNPVTGIPTDKLDMDPTVVFENLRDAGYVDDNGGVVSTSPYASFITKCIDRENPYGTSGADQTDDTADCFIDAPLEAEMYLYQADQRIVNVRENDTSGTISESEMPTGTCPAQTTVVPITEGWEDGNKKSITLCGIASLVRTPVLADSEFRKTVYGGLASIDSPTHAVNAVAADSLLKLISKADEDKVRIAATFSYRSFNEQKAIRAIKALDANGSLTNKTLPGNYSSQRAQAGHSNHQMGLSLDFSEGSKNWIKKCISNNLDSTDDNRCYGFYDDVGPSDPLHFTYKPA